jgi:hypothetical protein
LQAMLLIFFSGLRITRKSHRTCGSELARDDIFTNNIVVDGHCAIASELASTGFAFLPSDMSCQVTTAAALPNRSKVDQGDRYQTDELPERPPIKRR